jgi:ribosome-associated toxin RatA of RatAB toxin-antitoxin module
MRSLFKRRSVSYNPDYEDHIDPVLIVSDLGEVLQRIVKSAIVPFSSAQMFALVDDIEQYPLFVPSCKQARVLSRESTAVTGELTIAKGPIVQKFTTRNQLTFPTAISLDLVEGPFTQLQGLWSFEAMPASAGGAESCKVTLQLEFSFSNFLVKKALSPVFTSLANQMVQAFSQRAKVVYSV